MQQQMKLVVAIHKIAGVVKQHTNLQLQSLYGRSFLADVYWNEICPDASVVVYVHGFKGFKDWGGNHLMAQEMAEAGFVFVKFNFSHNGTTIHQPTDFADLEAFGNNNFSKELDDLQVVIDWASSDMFRKQYGAGKRISLMGHSRGGGIALLKAAEDSRVKRVVTLAAVNEFGKFWNQIQMEQLQRDGVLYVANQRTGQQMPIYKQMYDDYFAHLERLHIPSKVKELAQPLLIVHGTADATIPFRFAEELKQWKPDAELLLIEDADHNFGAKHPWPAQHLPNHLKEVLSKATEFLQ